MRNQRTSRRGNVVVEFALGWSLLWLLFSGIYHYGYSFYIYNLLQTTVANSAQLASQLNYDTASTASFATRVKNMAVYGDPNVSTGNPTVPSLTTANISVNVNLVNSIPTAVTVNIVNYSFSTIFSTMDFGSKPRVTVAYRGQVTCSTC